MTLHRLIVILVGLAALAGGFLIGRWLWLIPATLAWLLVALGLAKGWWGNGLGDGWQFETRAVRHS